jgi:hypothetical protein
MEADGYVDAIAQDVYPPGMGKEMQPDGKDQSRTRILPSPVHSFIPLNPGPEVSPKESFDLGPAPGKPLLLEQRTAGNLGLLFDEGR